MPPPKLQWLGPPGIFLPRELLPHGITIKRRVEHVAERPVLVEPAAHLLPRHRAGGRRDVTVHHARPLQSSLPLGRIADGAGHIGSPDGAKRNPGPPVPLARPFPDYASLHPGYGAFADDDARGSA